MFTTTTVDPSTRVLNRARLVARRCRVDFVQRTTSIPDLLQEHGSELAYVAGRVRDELRSADDVLFVHPGMLTLKRANGREHPFIRALCQYGPCASVVDTTMGLAADALHAAAILDAEVHGIEASPIVYSLLEEGLARLCAGAGPDAEAAARLSVEHRDAVERLAEMAEASVDVVIVDPMFDSPRPAAPGFALLRQVAHESANADALVEAGRRVARSHVVLKYPKRSTHPPCDACVDGKALRYLVYDATCRSRP